MRFERWYMIVPIVAVVVIAVAWWFWWGPVTTVVLVRHAEKAMGSGDVDLSTAGAARAQELARVLEKPALNAIYTSTLKRTKQTADPAEAVHGLTAIEFDPFEVEALTNHLLQNHSGGTVLVVGHSNTVDDVIEELGGPSIGDISDDEFDNLFVLTRIGGWRTRLTQLQYGAPSP